MNTNKKQLIIKIVVIALISFCMLFSAFRHIYIKLGYDHEQLYEEDGTPIPFVPDDVYFPEYLVMGLSVIMAIAGLSFVVFKMIKPEPKG